MEACGQHHAPVALPRGKELPVTSEQETGWAPGPVWTRWRREEIPTPAGKRTPVSSP